MQAVDKLARDLDEWYRRAGPKPDVRSFDALKTMFGRAVGRIPDTTVSAAYSHFLGLFSADGEEGARRALDWLRALGSLLIMDYDGTELNADEWREIREVVAEDSGEIDLDVLSYVMSRVLEHGGI